MDIQPFIFNWVGHESRTVALEAQLSAIAPVRVISSDSSVESRHPQWHHVGDDAYFSAQWARALDLFDGDVLFHVQADASSRHFATIFERCREAVQQHGCGVYAPNVDYTPWVFDRRQLRRVAEHLYEVPQTDCTCWAITREVLERAPRVDPGVNKFGWGIDFLVIGAARLLGRAAVRDYRYTIDHVWRGSGYDIHAAERQILATLESLPPEARAIDRALRQEAESKLGVQPWRRRLREAAGRLKRAAIG